MKSFLKYPGGKHKLVGEINKSLGEGSKLIEPFVGAGNVFINADFDRFVLNDINQDIIDIYHYVKSDLDGFMEASSRLFTQANNNEKAYYRHRETFNQAQRSLDRSALFLYLNRFGYNGLCRYNLSGGYNVPFGRYKRPYFPEKEMTFFSEKLKRATLLSADFGEAFRRARQGDVIYNDPPYTALSNTADFTAYSGKRFTTADQKKLVVLSMKARRRGIKVVISNHDGEANRELYREAAIKAISVRRTISCKVNRNLVGELLAVY